MTPFQLTPCSSYLKFSFGPDPYLNGEGAFETITGVQSVGVQACAKHLVANNQEHWRYGLTANADDRTFNEIYLYPFLRSIEVCQHWFRECVIIDLL
jgi:beta-glucosidase-like glycosyl hydrolase